jgi:hypothetical protein
MIFNLGATSQSADVQVLDDSGLPVTGLAAASFPASTYSLAGANADVSITLSDLSLITSAYSSGGIKERGNGYYRLDIPDAAFASAGEVTIRAEATGKHLVYAKLWVGVIPNFGSAMVTVTSPVAPGGLVTLYQGDDYNTTDGRALVWTGGGPNIWPNLTSASIAFTVYDNNGLVIFSIAGTVVTPTGTQVVEAQPTQLNTALLTQGSQTPYSVVATLSSGRVVTLVAGLCYCPIG